MKSSILHRLSLSVVLMSPLVMAAGCAEQRGIEAAHPQEVSHTESTKAGWFGGQVHEVNTVYKNADGSTSIESETTTTKGNTTTIVRDRKTTAVDGHVTTDRETRTIVKGTDNVVHETTTSG